MSKPLLLTNFNIVFLCINFLIGGVNIVSPVTSNASDEAKDLLSFIYEISGKQTISGQHCAPLVGPIRLSVVHRFTKKYPALFGQDFEGFNQLNYDQLLKLAGNKPIALGEVGRLPSLEKLNEQPRWTWFMNWGEPVRHGIDFKSFLETYDSDKVITLDELPGVDISDPKIHYPFIK